MAIELRLDVMMAKRRVRSNVLARAIGITESTLSLLKSGKVRGIRFSTLDAILPCTRMPARRHSRIRARGRKPCARRADERKTRWICQTRLARMPLLAIMAALGGCIETPPIADIRGVYTVSGPPSVTVPFAFDDNRMFVDIAFVELDGSLRKTRAFVNMGAGAFELSNKLYRELDAGTRGARMQIGGMTQSPSRLLPCSRRTRPTIFRSISIPSTSGEVRRRSQGGRAG